MTNDIEKLAAELADFIAIELFNMRLFEMKASRKYEDKAEDISGLVQRRILPSLTQARAGGAKAALSKRTYRVDEDGAASLVKCEGCEEARADAYREGAEKMREDAATVCFRNGNQVTCEKDLKFNSAKQEGASWSGYLIRKLPITPPQPEAQAKHELYQDSDEGVPLAIQDRNGSVVLSMCKKCGKAEVDLDVNGPCESEARDDKREMREAFERWVCGEYQSSTAEVVSSLWYGDDYDINAVFYAQWQAWQAAWKEARK